MARQALILLIVVLTFGVLVPWLKGVTLLQPVVVVAYASMALLFVAPAAAQFWAGIEAQASGAAVAARVVAIVGYGWGITVAMLVTALVTLNLSNRGGRILIPQTDFLGAVMVYSLTASLAVTVGCALLARRFSSASVKGMLRGFFLLALALLAFGSRVLPESWQIVLADHSTRRALTQLAWQASAICAIGAALGLVFLLRKAASRQSADI